MSEQKWLLSWNYSSLQKLQSINRPQYGKQAAPNSADLLHKQSRLINGKWRLGSARLGTALKERGCIETDGNGVSGGRKVAPDRDHVTEALWPEN